LRYRGVETKNGTIIEYPVNGGSKIKSNMFEGSEMNMAGGMDNLERVVMKESKSGQQTM
jgi:hypothetical protein